MKASKEDWIREGLQILYDLGPDSLVIEVLCNNLKRTKGSFYHHFESRNDYCEQLLSYWKNSNTLDIIRLSSKGTSSQNALARLSVLTANLEANPERAIRAWSFRDPIAANFQKEVDEWRIEYIQKLLLETYPPKIAELKAKIIHSIFLSFTLSFSPISKKELSAIYKQVVPETFSVRKKIKLQKSNSAKLRKT